MSIKNLLLEVYDAVCRARRLGQTTNLVRVAGSTNGLLITATKQQADQVEKDAWTSGLPEVKCVSVYSLAQQSRGRDPVPLYFDNHTVGDLAGRAADEIGKLESEIKKVSRDLQNMTHRAQVAERQVEVLRARLEQGGHLPPVPGKEGEEAP